MREHDLLMTFARRLFLRGLSPAYISRAVRELAEHREDIAAEAIDDGISRAEAETLAVRRLGDPGMLADAFVKRMQGGSWIGRHPWLGFCVLPLLAVIAWWAAYMGIVGWGTGVIQWSSNKSLPPPNWHLVTGLVEWCPLGAAAALPILFCWVARRSFRGFRWAFVACAILSLHSGMQFVKLTPPESGPRGDFTVGYRVPPSFQENASGFLLPLLVFALFVLLQLNSERKKLTL